jgi:uncharacterized damage-inducible protein DinB
VLFIKKYESKIFCMKSLLKKYADYNIWAHQRLFEQINKLNEIQIHTTVESSFNSIHKTVLHLLDAENIWWQRVKLVEQIIIPSQATNDNFIEVQNKLLLQSKQWQAWVSNANELQLKHVFAFKDKKNDWVKMPINEMLLHLFNHGTYHRGQLVTMLRQLGCTNIPQTDFSFYCRQLK